MEAIRKLVANSKDEGPIKGELRGTQLHYREVSVASAKPAAQEENGISVDRYRNGEYSPNTSDFIAASAAATAPTTHFALNRESPISSPPNTPAESMPDDPPHQGTGHMPVPAHIAAKYLVKNDKYHFDDQTLAFVDRGTRLTVQTLNKSVIQDLVAIAKAREWQEVTVRGAADFRREAWKAAYAAGLDVKGYTPSELELQAANKARLHRDAPNEVDREASAPTPAASTEMRASKTPSQSDRWTGTLVAFGSAPYQNDPEKSLSFFVTLKDDAGKEYTRWGVGLAEAISTSRSGVGLGDVVTLQRVGATTVSVPTRTVDENGEVVTEPLTTKRHQWVIEKRDFLKSGAAEQTETRTSPKRVASSEPTTASPETNIGKGQSLTRDQEIAAAVRSARVTREELQLRYPEINRAVFDHLSSHDQLAQAYAKAGLIRESDREQVIAAMRGRLGQQIERGDPIRPLDDKTVQRTIANSIRRVAADIGRAPVEINPERATEHVLTPKIMTRDEPQVRA